ncbi:hypothetical protein N8T08_002257 [Aspergillus melleus]|uniref:Uncharacterized protein n=1 Tax=Aspergillus melleus TaxID=138277 RepID=A0ACC3B8V1_9EURO|nr:hypothetical protein N8T08_002257 [Aspergillus melleus]
MSDISQGPYEVTSLWVGTASSSKTCRQGQAVYTLKCCRIAKVTRPFSASGGLHNAHFDDYKSVAMTQLDLGLSNPLLYQFHTLHRKNPNTIS